VGQAAIAIVAVAIHIEAIVVARAVEVAGGGGGGSRSVTAKQRATRIAAVRCAAVCNPLMHNMVKQTMGKLESLVDNPDVLQRLAHVCNNIV